MSKVYDDKGRYLYDYTELPPESPDKLDEVLERLTRLEERQKGTQQDRELWEKAAYAQGWADGQAALVQELKAVGEEARQRVRERR